MSEWVECKWRALLRVAGGTRSAQQRRTYECACCVVRLACYACCAVVTCVTSRTYLDGLKSSLPNSDGSV